MTLIAPRQIARWCLGLSWVYQGIAPKLISIAPLEAKLTGALGYDPTVSTLITRCAGIAEIIFGLLLIVFYQRPSMQFLNIFALLGLLLFSAIMLPSVLIEAFNPVTTNLCMIALSYYLWFESQNSE